MKKFLMIVGLLCLLVIGLCEALLPKIGASALERVLTDTLKTETVTVDTHTFPAVLMLAGYIGRIDIETELGMLGNLCTDRLSLHGEGVQMPHDVLTKKNFAINDADVLTLTGVVTEKNLADFLDRQVPQISNPSVTITKENMVADAKTKIMGQEADVHIEGVFFVEGNKICLRLTNVKVKKIFFGRDLTANFNDRIDIYDFGQLNMPVELDSAEHQDGQVVLKASRHPGKTYGDGRKRETGGKG